MITVTFATAIFLYLIGFLFYIFYEWIQFERGGTFKKYKTHFKEVWHCQICAHTYVNSKQSDMSRCPQCGSWNKK